MLALPFPTIDPIAVAIGPFAIGGWEIGPLAIRWYALAYIAGIVLGWRYIAWLADRKPRLLTRLAVDDFVVWATLGVILGGRLGYVLFYKPGYYLTKPWEIALVWHGGMSFHGGLIGVLLAIFLFARKNRIPWLAFGDIVAAAAPIGLFFGRVANFINGELYGRVSDAPWAMVFPGAGATPRHPSQLYEAALEGLVLFAVVATLAARPEIRARPGLIGGVFFVGYGLARIAVEFVREPDAHLGYLAEIVTMGQVLSLPMVAIGVALIVASGRRARLDAAR